MLRSNYIRSMKRRRQVSFTNTVILILRYQFPCLLSKFIEFCLWYLRRVESCMLCEASCCTSTVRSLFLPITAYLRSSHLSYTNQRDQILYKNRNLPIVHILDWTGQLSLGPPLPPTRQHLSTIIRLTHHPRPTDRLKLQTRKLNSQYNLSWSVSS